MSYTTLDGQQLYDLFAGGFRSLYLNKQVVDDLNVFPVPDGDTGENMAATLKGGVQQGAADDHAGRMMQNFSRGTLLSARGNSGVILSQFVRGFADGVKDCEVFTVADFPMAMTCGVKQAYQAVLNPVEGTMLTVLREGGERLAAFDVTDKSFEDCLELLNAEMKQSLLRTPDLLPVLKEAGVVDSGGMGLVYIFEGMLRVLRGEEIAIGEIADLKEAPAPITDNLSEEDLTVYGYCNEFILRLFDSREAFSLDTLIAALEELGDSIVAVQDEHLVKVHVHSFTPERVLAVGRKYGEFLSVKIENMSVQHQETVEARKPHVPIAVVATASGEGIAEYFKEIGVDEIVEGGQTNNPSTEDFVRAFKKLSADYIIVLPNDSNIVLAAEQAAKLYEDSQVRVLPTKSIPEGYSALSMMDLSLGDIDRVLEEMSSYLPDITSGYVTTSIRDAHIDGVNIHKGDYIGLTPKHMYASEGNKLDAAMKLFACLPAMEEKQVLTVFYGQDVTEEELSQLQMLVEEAYPLLEVGCINGKQDVYSFIFAIE